MEANDTWNVVSAGGEAGDEEGDAGGEAGDAEGEAGDKGDEAGEAGEGASVHFVQFQSKSVCSLRYFW